MKQVMPGVYQFGPAPQNDEELREQYRKMRSVLGKNKSDSNHEEDKREQAN